MSEYTALEVPEEHAMFTNAYAEELPETDIFDSLVLATAHMTDYEMIDFMTDMYVKKLQPVNYEAVEMEDMPCERKVVFERVYDWS